MRTLLFAALTGLTLSLGAVSCGDDADTDTEADTDTDTDTDTEAKTPCPENSGWPCSCSEVTACDDGTDCVSLEDMGDGTAGVCMAPCADSDDDCPAEDYYAAPHCSVGEPATYCVLWCTKDEHCPPAQACEVVDQSGAGICYPATSGG